MAANTVGEILDLRTFLKSKYSRRDTAYRQLRQLYNADYWSGKNNVTGIKLVYNLLANVVDRFTDFMSQSPDWRVLPSSMEKPALTMADWQEKYWRQGCECTGDPHLDALNGEKGERNAYKGSQKRACYSEKSAFSVRAQGLQCFFSLSLKKGDSPQKNHRGEHPNQVGGNR